MLVRQTLLDALYPVRIHCHLPPLYGLVCDFKRPRMAHIGRLIDSASSSRDVSEELSQMYTRWCGFASTIRTQRAVVPRLILVSPVAVGFVTGLLYRLSRSDKCFLSKGTPWRKPSSSVVSERTHEIIAPMSRIDHGRLWRTCGESRRDSCACLQIADIPAAMRVTVRLRTLIISSAHEGITTDRTFV